MSAPTVSPTSEARQRAQRPSPLESTAPVSTTPASRAITERIDIDNTEYRVHGEVIVLAGAAPVVVVVIERGAAAYPSDRELRAAFGLTRAESRVAVLLAERKSNNEIAEELGVTRHTARRHTERVLHKLGVHRRADVRHVLRQCVRREEPVPRDAASRAGRS